MPTNTEGLPPAVRLTPTTWEISYWTWWKWLATICVEAEWLEDAIALAIAQGIKPQSIFSARFWLKRHGWISSQREDIGAVLEKFRTICLNSSEN